MDLAALSSASGYSSKLLVSPSDFIFGIIGGCKIEKMINIILNYILFRELIYLHSPLLFYYKHRPNLNF